MRTTLPPKFVLAWPQWSGHKYLHYHCMLVDQETCRVWNFQDGYTKQPYHGPLEAVYDHAVVDKHTFEMAHHLKCSLSIRGIRNFTDLSVAAGLWTIRASQTGVKGFNFVTTGKVYCHGEETPIRFEPIRVNYFTGQMEYRSTDRPLPDIFWEYDERRWNWRKPKTQEDWEKLMDACEIEWRELSHSQFVFVSRLPYDAVRLRGTWRQRVRYVLEFYDHDRCYCGTLKTALGVERKPHGSNIRTVVKRCIKRFICRHPDRATSRLLQLLGAAGALKKSA